MFTAHQHKATSAGVSVIGKVLRAQWPLKLILFYSAPLGFTKQLRKSK